MVKITQIMKSNVVTATPDISLFGISKLMANNRLGSVVICDSKEKDKPLGIVTWSDLVTAVAKKRNLAGVKASEVMGKDLITADTNNTIMDVSRLLVKNNIDRVPVTNSGKLVGIVADKDVLAAAPEMIEILSEKLKSTSNRPPSFDDTISGMCENCEGYSNSLRNVDGQWICSGCKV
jgi:CBS domain-containing protein